MYSLHSMPRGQAFEQIGISPGSPVEILHRLSRLWEKVPVQLIARYRDSPVKHTDETGWRTDGKNGYAWLFATLNC